MSVKGKRGREAVEAEQVAGLRERVLQLKKENKYATHHNAGHLIV